MRIAKELRLAILPTNVVQYNFYILLCNFIYIVQLRTKIEALLAQVAPGRITFPSLGSMQPHPLDGRDPGTTTAPCWSPVLFITKGTRQTTSTPVGFTGLLMASRLALVKTRWDEKWEKRVCTRPQAMKHHLNEIGGVKRSTPKLVATNHEGNIFH